MKVLSLTDPAAIGDPTWRPSSVRDRAREAREARLNNARHGPGGRSALEVDQYRSENDLNDYADAMGLTYFLDNPEELIDDLQLNDRLRPEA